MGITKKIFQDYSGSQCDRQLFLNASNLDEDPSNWRIELDVLPRTGSFQTARYMQQLGNQYQRMIYLLFLSINDQYQNLLGLQQKIVHANRGNNEILSSALTPQVLNSILTQAPDREIALLEYEYQV